MKHFRNGMELYTEIFEQPLMPEICLNGTCPSSIPKSHPVGLEFPLPRPKWPYEVPVFLAGKSFCPLWRLHPLKLELVLGIM